MADKTYSFQGLSFSNQYCKQKLQDVLLLYSNLIGINFIIIIIIIIQWRIQDFPNRGALFCRKWGGAHPVFR